jgi:hypothetical protein
VLREFGVAGIVEGGEGPRQTEALVERAEGKQPASPENCSGDGSFTRGHEQFCD